MKRFLKILRFTGRAFLVTIVAVLIVSMGAAIYLVETAEEVSEQSQVHSFMNIDEVYAMNSPSVYGDNLSVEKSWTIFDLYVDNEDKVLVGTWKLGNAIDSCNFSFTFYKNKRYVVKSTSKKIGCTIPVKTTQQWDIDKNMMIINYGSKVAIKKLVADTIILIEKLEEEKEKKFSYVTFVRRK